MDEYIEKDKVRKMKDSVIIKRLLKYTKPFVWKFVLVLVLMLFVVIMDVLTPLLLGEVLERLGDDVINIGNIIIMIIGYIILLLLAYGGGYFQAIMLQKIGQSILYDIRSEVFTHIEHLSIAQINKTPVGKLVTRVTNDTNTLSEMFTNSIVNLIRNFATLLFVLIAMFMKDWKLTLYVLAVVPFIIVFTIIFKTMTRKAYREVRTDISNMNAFLSENLSGMKITQMFNQEKKQYNEFRNRNERLRKSSLKQTITFGIFRPTMYLLYVIAIIIVVYFGSMEVMNNPMVLFSLVYVFYQYVSKLFNPIQQLADQFNTIQSAFASSERIFEILDTESEIQDLEGAVEIDEFKGKIEFKNVWFAYEEENWILKDVSFVINPKETVAFVGATGAGKTTILSLIVRNYDIQKGQILIDDMDIKNIKLSSLRKNIGQMLQDVFLFSGTIKSNIQMREESITDEDIYNACEYVNANHFIEKLDHKYEEEVRERGNNFSSGQRQLLSFARTIVHKPQIMILDEATANIDTETEVLIQESLEKMRNIGTMLIVAHRLSTIQHSDKIVVLKHGEIQEIGNHQELLKKKGQYYELYKIQYEKKAGNSQEF